LIKQHDQERPEALDYYLKITGLSEEEFYKTISEKKLDQLKDVELPIHPKKQPNAERIYPFVDQIIQKHLNQPDPRVARDQKEKKQ